MHIVPRQSQDFLRSHSAFHAKDNEDVVKILKGKLGINLLHLLYTPDVIFGLFVRPRCGLQVPTDVLLHLCMLHTPAIEGRQGSLVVSVFCGVFGQ